MTPFKDVPGIKACAIQVCSTPMVHFQTTTISKSFREQEQQMALQIGLTKNRVVKSELACKVTDCLKEELCVKMWKQQKKQTENCDDKQSKQKRTCLCCSWEKVSKTIVLN